MGLGLSGCNGLYCVLGTACMVAGSFAIGGIGLNVDGCALATTCLVVGGKGLAVLTGL